MKTTALTVGMSGLIGTVLCLLADIGLKGEGSAIKIIRDNLAGFFGIGLGALLYTAVAVITLLIALGVACCFVFDEVTNAKAFYRGASVLAIAMTLVPNAQHPPAPGEKRSERVTVRVTASDGTVPLAIKVTVWDESAKSITSLTRYSTASFHFYQRAGAYRLDFESPGYRIVRRSIVVQDGTEVPPLAIEFRATSVPGFVQRVFPRE